MADLKIMTSSWYQYFGPGRIGISRGTPRGMAGGYKMYRKLAPTREILYESKGYEDYRTKYFRDVLGFLDPEQVVRDLTERSQEGIAVLLCFEKTPLHAKNWCHRTMAAEWLTDHGYDVEEWSGPKESNLQLSLDVTT